MLERGTERAMVMDFGIARLASASGETGVGEVMGTPEYMSPEQACGEEVDGRSDLYSLGVVGYFAISGALPSSGPPREVLAKQVTQIPTPVSAVARAAPQALATAIDRCLAKDPAARFPNGEALADALAQSIEKRTDVAIPLRVFIDRRHIMPLVAIPAMAVSVSLGWAFSMAQNGGSVGGFVAIAVTLVIGVGVPSSMLLARTRRLLRQGYGPSDVAAALRSLRERSREEFLYDFGPTTSTRERLLRVGGYAGLLAGAGATAALLMGIGPGVREAFSVTAFVGSYVGILMTVFTRKWKRLRDGKGSLMTSLWQGRVGQAMGRIAGYQLGARAIPPDRPTELGIAMSAEALYVGRPKEVRQTLGDVPSVLHGLEAQARAMQEQLVADLRAARATAEQRLADIVTALDTLRLNLLRLHAGAGSAESITQDLASAKSLGEDVDRLLEGGAEAERVVRLHASSNTA